jgi:chromatin segregation and condensation protein Rec8/ScpA/Scc1 (kleisin family)
MEEANFFISSKIMFATALLLRIKSELLLERYIKSLDDILFPKLQQEQPKPQINISLDDVTELLPRTPLPRLKKVTLQELMSALDRAMITEQRRIKKEIKVRQLVAQTTFFLPRQKVNIRDKIQEIYSKIKGWFKQQTAQKMAFTQLAGNERNNRISTFIPLLHLDHQERVLLEQEKTFDEIFIYLFR